MLPRMRWHGERSNYAFCMDQVAGLRGIVIERPQVLVPSVKFPGAFRFTCELLFIDGRHFAWVSTAQESTDHNGLYRLTESAFGGRAPGSPAGIYRASAVCRGRRLFTLTRAEKAGARIEIEGEDGYHLGALQRSSLSRSFVLLDPSDERIASVQARSVRGLDYDVRPLAGEPWARIRFKRRTPAQIVARRSRLAFAPKGMADAGTADRWLVTLDEALSDDLRRLLLAVAVAASA